MPAGGTGRTNPARIWALWPMTSGGTPMSPARKALIMRIAGLTLFLAAWEAASRLGLIGFLLGSPSAVATAGMREVSRGELWGHLAVSAAELALGLLLATAIGVSIGVAAGWSRSANYLLDPWLTILNATPVIALVPLIIFIFGIDLGAKVFVVLLFCIFPIAINTMTGVTSTAAEYLKVAKAYRAKPSKILRTVVLPGTLPFIAAGLQVGVGRALVGVVVAELVAANAGIGFLLNLYGATLQIPKMLFLVVILGLAGVALKAGVSTFEHRLAPWRPRHG